ncbi:MarR family transcriptional regulator [Sandaracinomonas limnophila]|uniref:MarR family transcriptional regulator n=1 Tax=Sandaracinomonas limnophila TaxID=1862386 RepID=A0A437PU47_9BACT|nr:MarR family transcriptional regulator [Sandaracinomonas limnophila]RVU25758.1 MarR family transcriptional regulator [Sandaracinomonas limnophila]
MKAENTIDFQIKSSWYAISRMYNNYAAHFDMTMAIGYVLLHIDKEGTPATKIAPALGLEVRSLTRMLKTLEEKKWIKREANYNDKRIVKIFLTEKGKQKRDQAKQGVILFNELIKQKISAEKLEVFFDVMKIINNALEEDPKLILEGIQKHIKS